MSTAPWPSPWRPRRPSRCPATAVRPRPRPPNPRPFSPPPAARPSVAERARPPPPSQARALVAEARSGRGRPLREIVEEARLIVDPGYAAEALVALSTDPRLLLPGANTLLTESLQQALKVE